MINIPPPIYEYVDPIYSDKRMLEQELDNISEAISLEIAAEIQKQIEEHTKMNSLCQPQSK